MIKFIEFTIDDDTGVMYPRVAISSEDVYIAIDLTPKEVSTIMDGVCRDLLTDCESEEEQKAIKLVQKLIRERNEDESI
jgi:hypothetical protein